MISRMRKDSTDPAETVKVAVKKETSAETTTTSAMRKGLLKKLIIISWGCAACGHSVGTGRFAIQSRWVDAHSEDTHNPRRGRSSGEGLSGRFRKCRP